MFDKQDNADDADFEVVGSVERRVRDDECMRSFGTASGALTSVQSLDICFILSSKGSYCATKRGMLWKSIRTCWKCTNVQRFSMRGNSNRCSGSATVLENIFMWIIPSYLSCCWATFEVVLISTLTQNLFSCSHSSSVQIHSRYGYTSDSWERVLVRTKSQVAVVLEAECWYIRQITENSEGKVTALDFSENEKRYERW